MRRIFTALLLLFAANTPAWANFSYNAKVRAIHEDIHALRFDETVEQLNDIKNDANVSGFYHYLSQYHEVLTLLISQDKDNYKAFTSNSNVRRTAVSGFETASPWQAYCLAEMDLFEAMAHAKFGQMNKAASSVSKAYKLLEQNTEQYPEFLPQYKTLGLLEAGIGTIPDIYRKMIRILGYKGTIASGYAKLKKALNIQDDELSVIVKEAAYLKMAVELYLLNDADKAWETIDLHTKDYRENLLAAFFRANTAMKCGKNDEAIRVLKNRPQTSAYAPFPFLDFMLGSAKLYRLDADSKDALLQFIQEQKDGDYIKSAYFKLTWYYTVFPDTANYARFRKMTISHGEVSLEEDRQALFEILDGNPPDRDLLRVRCLFDGGYYRQAESIIRPMRERHFTRMEHRLEYNYRKGRVFQKLADTSLARAFYLEAIDRGKNGNSKSYYVAYSAYHVGEMHEQRNEYSQAEKYYKMAIALGKSTNFRKSIEHRAKSGLGRLEK